MAFKELAYIAQYQPVRRESIFKDLRKPDAAWSQVLTECRAAIKAIVTSIDPPQPASVPPRPQQATEGKAGSTPTRLEKEAKKPAEEDIWRTPSKKPIVEKWQA